MKTICILLIIILILYLYSIKPRLFHRPDYSILKGYYYAHRGLHNMNPARPEQTKGNIPENSYTAIQKAVELGYSSYHQWVCSDFRRRVFVFPL